MIQTSFNTLKKTAQKLVKSTKTVKVQSRSLLKSALQHWKSISMIAADWSRRSRHMKPRVFAFALTMMAKVSRNGNPKSVLRECATARVNPANRLAKNAKRFSLSNFLFIRFQCSLRSECETREYANTAEKLDSRASLTWTRSTEPTRSLVLSCLLHGTFDMLGPHTLQRGQWSVTTKRQNNRAISSL